MTASPGDVLDDVTTLEGGDPGGMLLAVASAAAQIREAAVLASEAGVAVLGEEGRPRAVVVCGMGGSGIAGDVLAAVAGIGSPVPVFTHRGYGLPAWVGPMDLVMAVSCSGTTEETLSSLEEAVRRGCRLLVVARSGSPSTTSDSGAGRSSCLSRRAASSARACGRCPRPSCSPGTPSAW